MGSATNKNAKRSGHGRATDGVSAKRKGRRADKQLEERVAAIQREWREAKKKRTANSQAKEDAANSRPYDQPIGVLKRMVYQLAFDVFHTKFGSVSSRSEGQALNLVNRVRKSQPSLSAPRDRTDIFLAILDLVASDSHLSRSEKHRIAVELGHARRHRIPAEMVVGFAYQSGGHKLIQQMQDEKTGKWSKESWWRKGQELQWVDAEA